MGFQCPGGPSCAQGLGVTDLGFRVQGLRT